MVACSQCGKPAEFNLKSTGEAVDALNGPLCGPCLSRINEARKQEYLQRQEAVQREIDAGVEFFSQILRSTGNLELRRAKRYEDWPDYYYFRFGFGEKEQDVAFHVEFLAEIRKNNEYQGQAKAYVRCLTKRMQNPSPSHFYVECGVPISVDIVWPVQKFYPWVGGGRISSVVRDLRGRTLNVSFDAKISEAHFSGLSKNTFLLEKLIINGSRRAADDQKLYFFPSGSLGSQECIWHEATLDPQPTPRRTKGILDSFIAGKVYWLAFKQGDKTTRVWIADELDAEYLETNVRALIQAAQILEAQRMIVLDSSQEYASAGDRLLSQAKTFESERALAVDVQNSLRQEPTPRQEQKWDAFICHASEDKNEFGRPLAEGLRREGLKVWYDEFTLKVGDSLRREIDRGLRNSRYGVVVLSPAFFARDWPQWELDGLVAKEMDGKKVILPVWHNVTRADVRRYSPPLSDKIAANSSEGISAVVARLLDAIKD